MADNAKAKLLSILQARQIPLTLDDIQWAFESEAASKEAIAWIEEYLNEATLLTKDELDLYNAIGETTKLELSTASHDVPAMYDRDIKEAIAAIKSSTSAIENHIKALEAQMDACRALTGDESEQNGGGNAGLVSRYDQERSSLNFTIEDLTYQVDERLKEAEDQLEKALTTTRTFSTERLGADEQVLEALSGLSTKVASSDDTSVDHAELEKWLESLAALRAAEVRAKIDTMLAGAGSLSNEALGDDGAELQTELRSLKDEIDSITHMVIAHELRNPLLKSLEASEKSSRQNRNGWSRYLISTLDYLVKHLNAAATKVVDLRNYTDAIVEIRQMVMDAEKEGKAANEDEASAKRPSLQDRSKSSSSQLQLPAASSVPQALRRLNIRPSDYTTSTQITRKLDTHAVETASKLQAQYASTEKVIIDSLGKSLSPRQQDTMAILKQLYASSKFNAIALSDQAIDAQVATLARKIDEIAPKVAAGDLR